MLSTREAPGDAGYFDFSFSGLKTAASLMIGEIEADVGIDIDAARAHVAAEFQAAVVDVLVAKTMRAVERTGCRRVLLGGGVARNALLRESLAAALEPAGRMFAPSPRLSTDNAAMVARLAEHRLSAGQTHDGGPARRAQVVGRADTRPGPERGSGPAVSGSLVTRTERTSCIRN
jgi:N6-L-threonylcarbamoyladenine synthase